MITQLTTLFDLHRGEEDKLKTLNQVKNNIYFRGANLWILACAIMIASVGLNVNSTAVIIGAMLISPLMGPIVGAGFALGIFDFELLKKSLLNLLLATIVGLLVSMLYFYLSPLKEVQSELLARTSPNIYDVLIAFFGGLVGVIAITRVEKGNPIPGVAIATALMPPLCTAGFGIASGNYRFFFGAFFLYAINCVFICISTYLVVKYLNYPAKEEIDAIKKKRIKYFITALVIVMLIPSAYFAFSLYKQQKFKQDAEQFITQEFTEKGYTIIYKKTNYSTLSRTIELAFLNKKYTPEELNILNDDLKKFGLTNTKLVIKQNTDNLEALRSDILNEVNKSGTILTEKDKQIELLKQEIAANTFDNKEIYDEVKTIFPAIQDISIANHTITSNDTAYIKTIFLYKSNPELSTTDKQKLQKWLEVRLPVKEVDAIRSN